MSDFEVVDHPTEPFDIVTPIFYVYNHDPCSVFAIVHDYNSQPQYRTVSLNMGAMQGGRRFDTIKDAYQYLKKQDNVSLVRLQVDVVSKFDNDFRVKKTSK